MYKTLKQNVARVRKEFEHGKIPPLVLASIYGSYNPVSEVTKFVSRAAELFPAWNCGVTTAYLQQFLKTGEIVNGTYDGKGHTFLLIDESLVVDITADQFGGPKTYVGPLKSPGVLGGSLKR